METISSLERFSVKQDENTVAVTRIDQILGWDIELEFECCLTSNVLFCMLEIIYSSVKKKIHKIEILFICNFTGFIFYSTVNKMKGLTNNL